MGKQLNRLCLVCDTEFTTYPSLNKRYCSPQCAQSARRKGDDEYTANYRMVNVPPDHPLASGIGRRIPLHRLLLWEAIGPGPHPCYRCKRLIDWAPTGVRTGQGALIVDHADRNRLNNELSNLRPACHGCNMRNSPRAIRPEETYRHHSGKESRTRAERRSCEYCRAEFVAWPDKDPRRGRFCSRSCARRTPRSA